MSGYKIGSSLAKVYTMAITSPMENLKHGWKKDMVANMAKLFARGNLKPSNKKLCI